MDAQTPVSHCPTAEELDKNHNLLLHRQLTNTARPLTPHDCSSAAVLSGGRFFITTPYRELPLYTTGPIVTNMRLRRDFRFGEHDYLQWPQHWFKPLCHLACIMRRPSPGHEYFVMWWTPTKDFFAEERRGIATGLGKLKLTKRLEIRRVVTGLLQRSLDFVDLHSNKDEVELARKYSRVLRDHLNRLDSLLFSFRQICYAVAAVQRMFLELLALLDYCQVYKPRMNGSNSSSSEPEPLVGAFTWDINDAELLFLARIPFWFIRKVEEVPKVSVAKLSPLVPIALVCQDECPFPEPVVFCGVPNIEVQYTAINNHLLTIFNTHSPFESLRRSRLELASSSNLVLGPNRSSRHNNRSSPYSKQTKTAKPHGRDKFSLPDHELFPPASPCWPSALSRVDRSSPPDPIQGGYAFPDPALIVTVAKYEKTQIYCWNWLRFRDILLFRLSQPSPKLIPNSTWRQLLNGDYKVDFRNQTNQKTAVQKAHVRDLLGNCLLSSGVDIDLDNAPGVVYWKGASFSAASQIPQPVVKEIIWELSLLNFRCELSALDKLLVSKSLNDEASTTHAAQLRGCFSGSDPSNLLNINVDDAHGGFAARMPTARKSSLLALRDVMMDWPCFRERCCSVKDLREDDLYNDIKLELFEIEVVGSYLQYFFDTFGRAAITPLRLDPPV
ncbi:hypothetical protein VKT23_003404 [Stygiomarasmius scandens]|uniref:Uncharacterized protein n=1 Tax=Marasmiellus scandens TaxID=2682957 RepID=A0ABR1JZF8_9AGAR